MIVDLLLDFYGSQRFASAWRDHIWERRLEGEPARNKARLAAYEARKAHRREEFETGALHVFAIALGEHPTSRAAG